ncbi:hypothetical protein DPPLL_35010 [Desulfofustis limnaeus]|uniref:Uncharacterized protein n=1 Tax=Desulfofustis limnaeus TaxID=2740163 RepID=A0ABN6MBE1_9BACT|nr:hypothetical protein DPPLL_35010 [Desulfofustis limnaeus]
MNKRGVEKHQEGQQKREAREGRHRFYGSKLPSAGKTPGYSKHGDNKRGAYKQQKEHIA